MATRNAIDDSIYKLTYKDVLEDYEMATLCQALIPFDGVRTPIILPLLLKREQRKIMNAVSLQDAHKMLIKIRDQVLESECPLPSPNQKCQLRKGLPLI